MHQKITITQPWASSTTAQIWWTPKISLCSFFALQYMLVLDVNVFLLEKWQYVTKMLLFYCRTEIPKLDLKSARVPVSQLFKKTALVKIKAAESLRRFVNLTSFKSVWQQSWDLLDSRGATSGSELWNQLTLSRKSSEQPRINADWTLK